MNASASHATGSGALAPAGQTFGLAGDRLVAVESDDTLLRVYVPGSALRVVDKRDAAAAASLVGCAGAWMVGRDLKPVVKALGDHASDLPCGLFDVGIATRLLAGGRPLPSVAHSLQDLPDVARALDRSLRGAGLTDTMALEMAVLPAVVDMERAGLPLDTEAWDRLVNHRAEEAARLEQILQKSLGLNSMNNGAAVRAALSSTLGLDLVRTDRASLARLMHVPVVQTLANYRRLSSFANDLGRKVLATAVHGRAHAEFDQVGCVTGRFTTTQLNLQGMPRDPLVRACIRVPAGKLLLRADHVAHELRILACVAGDTEFQDLFARRLDPHVATAAMMLGKSPADISESERRMAKPINFGCAFAVAARGLAEIALETYGMTLSVEQAEAFREAFFAKYTGVQAWQTRVREQAPAELRTLGGRVRYFDGGGEQFNARLAYAVQGTAADGIKNAIATLHPRLRALRARLVLVMHDELIVEADQANAIAVLRELVGSMERGLGAYLPGIPVEVQPGVGMTWAEAME